MAQDLRHFTIPQQRPRTRRDDWKNIVSGLLIVVIVVVFVWAFGPWSNTEDPNVTQRYRAQAVHAAEVLGFTQVSVTATHRRAMLNGCDENDRYAFEATGTKEIRPTPVSLLVCCGSGSTSTDVSCTVRIR